MIWRKRNENINDFRSYVVSKTGKSIDELINDDNKVYRTNGLDLAAEILMSAGRSGNTVSGVFDYDVDGICSTSEMHMLLSYLNIKHTLTIPKRFTDGYGINASMVERFPDNGILVTVDNGIAGNDAITKAKNKGMTVLIMDHHNAPLKNEVDPAVAEASRKNGTFDPLWMDLPNADVIIDPEAPLPDGWDFTHYCAAGLVYKLAQYMIPNEVDLLAKMSCFAAIATIADSVNVTGDNRNIVHEGLKNINAGNCTEGLLAVLNLLRENNNIDPFTAESLAYYIGPMINAPGRLQDNGGEFVVKTFFAKGEKAKQYAEQLVQMNEERKTLVQQALDTMEPIGDRTVFLYDESLKEGLCGIIAGRLANTYHRPAFVCTLSDDGVTVKGSARSEEDYNVFTCLQNCASILTAFGGHDQAAGFSLLKTSLPKFLETLENTTREPSAEGTEFYDFEVMPADILPLYCDQNKIEIFGEGLSLPVIKMRSSVIDVREIGKDKNHLSFKMANTKCIAFNMAEKYKELNNPDTITVYGTLSVNWYKGRPSPQIQVTDFEADS